MVRKRVNKTANQLLWEKQIKRIKQFIHRAEKRGYIFDTSVISEKPKRITKKALQRLQQLKPKDLYKFSVYVDPVTQEQTSGLEGRKLEIKKRTEKIQATKQAHKASKPTSPIKQITITEDEFIDVNSSNINADTYNDNCEEYTEYSNSPNYKYSDLPTFSYVVIENIRDEIRQWTPGRNWSTYWTEIKRNDKNVLETLLETTIANEGENVVATRLQNSATNIDRIVQSILYNSDREQVQLDIVEFATIIKGRALSIEESCMLTEIQEYQEEQEI